MAGGVRGYPSKSRSFEAVCFRIDTTSRADRSGFAEITRAATPATRGAALEVPPKCSVTGMKSPVVVVMPRPDRINL